jgi:hypothetical protein
MFMLNKVIIVGQKRKCIKNDTLAVSEFAPTGGGGGVERQPML